MWTESHKKNEEEEVGLLSEILSVHDFIPKDSNDTSLTTTELRIISVEGESKFFDWLFYVSHTDH